MTKKISMRKIAEELNLAESTVSRALSGKKGISEHTRQRVIAAARRHGYVAKLIPIPKPVQVALLVEQNTLQERRFWSYVINGLIAEISLHNGILFIIIMDTKIGRAHV